MAKYRIILDANEYYAAQHRSVWWWPFWMTIGYSGNFDRAESYIKRHRNRGKIVAVYDE